MKKRATFENLDGAAGVTEPAPDPLMLLNQSYEERVAILASSAAAAAGLYEADLALPIIDRELTAFEHIDDFKDPDDYLRGGNT